MLVSRSATSPSGTAVLHLIIVDRAINAPLYHLFAAASASFPHQQHRSILIQRRVSVQHFTLTGQAVALAKRPLLAERAIISTTYHRFRLHGPHTPTTTVRTTLYTESPTPPSIAVTTTALPPCISTHTAPSPARSTPLVGAASLSSSEVRRCTAISTDIRPLEATSPLPHPYGRDNHSIRSPHRLSQLHWDVYPAITVHQVYNCILTTGQGC